MKAGLVGQSYQLQSLPFDAQRTINLYPVVNETGQGKEIAALYGTPGFTRIVATSTPYLVMRGLFASANGRAFMLAGNSLYEVLEASGTYTKTLLGTIDSTDSIVTWAESPTQLAICDGYNVFIYTFATGALAKVTDANFPGIATITFQDGYFMGDKVGTGEWYISGLNDGFTWDALDFATAESSPDPLVRVYSAYGQVWLLGNRTTEVWYNSGDATFPFARIEGAKMQTGCLAPLTVVDADNSLFWLGRDRYGKGIIYKAVGYSASRISTFAVEYALSQATDLESCRAWAYQESGRLFYVLTGGGLASAWVYDTSTQQWHERASLNDNSSEYVQWRAQFHMYAFDTHIVADSDQHTLYAMSSDYYSEFPDVASDRLFGAIKRQRVFTHIYDEGKRFRISELRVDFEVGQGLQEDVVSSSGEGDRVPGDAAYCWLEISHDLGKTWSTPIIASIGAVGEYKKRAVWRRLGYSDSWTFRVTISDPVRVAITGAYIK